MTDEKILTNFQALLFHLKYHIHKWEDKYLVKNLKLAENSIIDNFFI